MKMMRPQVGREGWSLQRKNTIWIKGIESKIMQQVFCLKFLTIAKKYFLNWILTSLCLAFPFKQTKEGITNEKIKKCQATSFFGSRTMRSKKYLNVSCSSCLKGGMELEGMGYYHCPQGVTWKGWHRLQWCVKLRCINKAPQLKHRVSHLRRIQLILLIMHGRYGWPISSN
jgi:hypothetical protein